jgi:hypothetical protein
MIDEMNPRDGISRIGCLREVTRRFSGYPAYADQVLLITAPGREPFAPVSLGDALHAWIANASRDNWGKARAQELPRTARRAESAPARIHAPNTGRQR